MNGKLFWGLICAIICLSALIVGVVSVIANKPSANPFFESLIFLCIAEILHQKGIKEIEDEDNEE